MEEKPKIPLIETLGTTEQKEVIRINDVFGLATFEDSIEKSFQPLGVYGNKVSWHLRKPLANLLRPNKYHGVPYNGNLFKITLEAMEDPVAELVDVRKSDEFKIYNRQHFTNNYFESVVRNAAGCILGFDVHATGKSTGRSEFDISSKVWYFRGLNTDIRRIITEPNIDKEDNIETYRAIGWVATKRKRFAKHSPMKTLKRH